MRLYDLLRNYLTYIKNGTPNIIVDGLCSHPEKTKLNFVFFYFIVDPDYRNLFVDYRRCLSIAIEKGAAAVVIDPELKLYDTALPLYDYKPIIEEFSRKIIVIQIPSLAEHFGYICSRFYNEPSQNLSVIAVTGTNGKTSTTHIISSIFNEYRPLSCGLIGSLGYGVSPKSLIDTGFTTPDADILHDIFYQFLEKKIYFVSIEASSQGIDFKRLSGTKVNTAVFLNLGHEHLDYHESMEKYYKAKSELFKFDGLKNIVVNLDNPYGIRLIEENVTSSANIYGLTRNTDLINFKSSRKIHLLKAFNVVANLNGLYAEFTSPWGNGEIKSNFIGDFYIYNLLAAICCCSLSGIPLNFILEIIPKLNSILGRMNIFQEKEISIVVDYAHCPQSLHNVLSFLSKNTSDLTCVFGCGGMRDKTKRPIMAAIAEKYSSKVILTNNITRGESEYSIAVDTIAGFKDFSKINVILNRSEAIKQSIYSARKGSIIAVCGRGHEEYLVDNKIETDISIVNKTLKYISHDFLSSDLFKKKMGNLNFFCNDRLLKVYSKYINIIFLHSNVFSKKNNSITTFYTLLEKVRNAIMKELDLAAEISFEFEGENDLNVTIQTKRLYIKSVSKENYDDYHNLFTDAEVMATYGELKIWTEEKLNYRFNTWVDRWKNNDPFSAFAISTNLSESFVGNVVLGYSETPGISEIAYAINRNQWNKGYASESVYSIVNDYAPKLIEKNYKCCNKNLESIIATCTESNIPSRKVLEKSGMVIVDELYKNNTTKYLFQINASKFCNNKNLIFSKDTYNFHLQEKNTNNWGALKNKKVTKYMFRFFDLKTSRSFGCLSKAHKNLQYEFEQGTTSNNTSFKK